MGSNITYVMKNDITQLSTAVDENMVTFTDFNNTGTSQPILVTGRGSSANSILVNINVQKGAKINAFLSEDGQNRATIDGSGRLQYMLDFAGRDKLTGTYIIDNGNLRYTPPLMTQKNFDILRGSAITWSGDMLNPQLDLKGTERLKASVIDESNNSYPADFVIDANVGGSLNVIDLKFDMDCESDMTVRNELQSMSDNHRSQKAIEVLLTNTYYKGESSALNSFSSQTATSPLFSFLQSKLNAWAAQTLPGIDLSFGINQYERTLKGGTETSYSYRLAKNLFNDRFRIVVGGEYSTMAEEDENVASSLFSDVSLEYYLNDVGNRYLKLFRQYNHKNPLEDKVTETGVAYVLKRKLTNLKNFFTFKHSREYLLRDSLEKARKAELKLQESAIDAMSSQEQTFIVPLDGQDIDKPTVIRKKDDESEE